MGLKGLMRPSSAPMMLCGLTVAGCRRTETLASHVRWLARSPSSRAVPPVARKVVAIFSDMGAPCFWGASFTYVVWSRIHRRRGTNFFFIILIKITINRVRVAEDLHVLAQVSCFPAKKGDVVVALAAIFTASVFDGAAHWPTCRAVNGPAPCGQPGEGNARKNSAEVSVVG